MSDKNSVPSKYLSIPISKLLFEGDEAKLIRRIEKLREDIGTPSGGAATIGDLMAVNPADFGKIRGVGDTYGKLLFALQSKLPARLDLLESTYIKIIKHGSEAQMREYALMDVMPNVPSKLSRIFLNFSKLSVEQKKLLRKIEKFFGRNDVQLILTIDRSELVRQGGFGIPTLRLLDDLREILSTDLMRFVAGEDSFDFFQKSYFVIAEYFEIELAQIDQLLLDDIEDFLFELSASDRDLIISRWGFHCQALVLEEIAVRLDVSRERVRQKEQGIISELRSCMRIHPAVVRENILKNYAVDLVKLFPSLSCCFSNERDFYSCIEAVCNVENGSIYNDQRPQVSSTLLDDYFATNLVPVQHALLVVELESNYGYSAAQSINVIQELKKLGKLKLEGNEVYPSNLGKVEAVAQIMLSHPNGLPWKDIARITNRSQICGAQVSEERQNASYLGESEYLYLSNRGVYRHRKFLDLIDVNVQNVMEEMFEFLTQNSAQDLNLVDFYHRAKPIIKKIDYYDLREIIRSQGEGYGFFFNGKSNVDGVGMIKDFSPSNQRDLIRNLLTKSTGAMTKAEIAERLRSKSIRHANFYLGQMIEDGEVIRIDNMMYTTPENGFRNVDTHGILMHMGRILSSSDKIIEIDIFRKHINAAMNLSYTKYFYSAVGTMSAGEFSWKKRHNLFSTREIQYGSLTTALTIICDPSLSNLENSEKIRKEFLITDDSLAIAIQNWRASLK
jgi:hypothetical protein